MNPTSNKKDFEELTTNLKDLAHAYLEKYSASKQQLKIYLLKKYLTKFNSSKSKKDLSNIIDKVLMNLEENKLINDELYSDSKARVLLRRGYSINRISQSLRQKGIKSEFIKLEDIVEISLSFIVFDLDATTAISRLENTSASPYMFNSILV